MKCIECKTGVCSTLQNHAFRPWKKRPQRPFQDIKVPEIEVAMPGVDHFLLTRSSSSVSPSGRKRMKCPERPKRLPEEKVPSLGERLRTVAEKLKQSKSREQTPLQRKFSLALVGIGLSRADGAANNEQPKCPDLLSTTVCLSGAALDHKSPISPIIQLERSRAKKYSIPDRWQETLEKGQNKKRKKRGGMNL